MRAFFPSIFLVATMSCSLVVPGDQQQCTTDEDCTELGFVGTCEDRICVAPPIDPAWGCLGMVEEGVLQPGVRHTYRQQIVDVISTVPPPGMSIRLCSSVDLECTAPLEEDVAFTSDGFVSVSVPSGFLGFLEVNSDATMPAIIPIGPVFEDIDMGTEPIQLVSLPIVESLAEASGFSVNATKGHVLSLMVGCDATGRAGISFTSDGTGVPFFLIGNNPDRDATQSDDTGGAGILNVDPGFVNITSTRVETGQFISTKRVLIRVGTMTYVALSPTPV